METFPICVHGSAFKNDSITDATGVLVLVAVIHLHSCHYLAGSGSSTEGSQQRYRHASSMVHQVAMCACWLLPPVIQHTVNPSDFALFSLSPATQTLLSMFPAYNVPITVTINFPQSPCSALLFLCCPPRDHISLTSHV